MRRGERGQILVPALMTFPMMFLFVILIVELGRLSREKIRHQFALDAGASLEMNQYTDLLNRTAYVNGAFPQRVFQDIYGGSWNEYFANGLFPGFPGSLSADDREWPIQFGPGRSGGNVADPPENFGVLHMHLPGSAPISLQQAEEIAAGYISVYQWMGDVAASQKMLFDKSTQEQHALIRKSLWLNLDTDVGSPGCPGGPSTCGGEAAGSFGNIQVRMHYVSGFKHCPVTVTIAGSNYSGELSGPFGFSGSGLFQLATVPQSDLQALEQGYVVKQHWIPPRNAFGYDFYNNDSPYVRARVTSAGGSVWFDGPKGRVHTTPKYFTKLHP